MEFGFFQQEVTERLKQIFCWNVNHQILHGHCWRRRELGEKMTAFWITPSPAPWIKHTRGPRWCHCRLQLEIGIVGNWCVRHFGREWAVINIGQGAAVRTAGETRAVFCFFFNPRSEVQGRRSWKGCSGKRQDEDCARAAACRRFAAVMKSGVGVSLQNSVFTSYSWKETVGSWCRRK